MLNRRPPVLSKADFARRYAAGEFGNRSPTWNTPEEFFEWASLNMAKAETERFHLRNRTAGGSTYYNLTFAAVLEMWNLKRNPGGWYLSMMAPEADKVFQGEVWRSPGGLYVNYNTLPLPMREGMALESRHAVGLRAKLLLDGYMCPRSREWTDYLLDEYDGHTVEFSTYSREWGAEPGFNTVFWEVRLY